MDGKLDRYIKIKKHYIWKLGGEQQVWELKLEIGW